MWEEGTRPQPEKGTEPGILDIVADFVDMYDLQVSVTLAMQGIIVSGVLIGSKAFVAEVGRLLDVESSQLLSEAGSELRQALANYAERQVAVLTEHAPLEGENDRSHTPLRTLYLKHAQLLRGDDTIHLPLWACSLHAVSGFSLAHSSI
jgi:hypothetical protein